MSVSGDKAHIDRLRRMRSPKFVNRVGQAVFVGAVEIQAEARLLISTGAVSGANHIPSAPGEPPNFDSGHLSGNIEAVRTGPMKAQVESRAEYAIPLEIGSADGTLEARPYMGPATRNKRKRVTDLIRKAAQSVIGR